MEEEWSLRLPDGLGLSSPDNLEITTGILRWTMRSWEEEGALRLSRRLRWDASGIEGFDEGEWEDAREQIEAALSGHLVLGQKQP